MLVRSGLEGRCSIWVITPVVYASIYMEAADSLIYKRPHEGEWLLNLQLIPEEAEVRYTRDDCLKYGDQDSFLFKDIKFNHSLN
jgi:hypothetical protein